MSRVLDASVFIAAMSPPERNHAQALRLYRARPPGGQDLVPAVFRVEVVAALSRRREPTAVIDAADALVQGPRFRRVELDDSLVAVAAHVARQAGVRAYDALYAAVALREGAPLCTLDGDLVTRLAEAFPEIEIAATGQP